MYGEIEGIVHITLSAHRLCSLLCSESPAFAFLRLLNRGPAEIHGLQVSPFMRNRLVELQQENKIIEQSTVLR